MIRHIKMLDFHKDMSDSGKRIAAFNIKKGIEGLNGKIKDMVKVEAEAILLGSSNADMVIVGEFNNEEAIEAYENSPLRLNFSSTWDKAVACVKTANFID